jgi:hypothetical protein
MTNVSIEKADGLLNQKCVCLYTLPVNPLKLYNRIKTTKTKSNKHISVESINRKKKTQKNNSHTHSQRPLLFSDII